MHAKYNQKQKCTTHENKWHIRANCVILVHTHTHTYDAHSHISFIFGAFPSFYATDIILAMFLTYRTFSITIIHSYIYRSFFPLVLFIPLACRQIHTIRCQQCRSYCCHIAVFCFSTREREKWGGGGEGVPQQADDNYIFRVFRTASYRIFTPYHIVHTQHLLVIPVRHFILYLSHIAFSHQTKIKQLRQAAYL